MTRVRTTAFLLVTSSFLSVASGQCRSKRIPSSAEALALDKDRRPFVSLKFRYFISKTTPPRNERAFSYSAGTDYQAVLSALPTGWTVLNTFKGRFEKDPTWLATDTKKIVGLVEHETGLEVVIGGVRRSIPAEIRDFVEFLWDRWTKHFEDSVKRATGSDEIGEWSLIYRCPGRRTTIRLQSPRSGDFDAFTRAAARVCKRFPPI